MYRDISRHSTWQVFLNYPFDLGFSHLADAMSFAVVSGGLLPVCARDLNVPDRPRLEMLVDAIQNCQYSAHDFSRFTGEGANNFSRMNMPIEMGMAVFYAISSQRHSHRCSFYVPTQFDYQAFASDLAGLDPKFHDNDEKKMLCAVYDWLRSVVPGAVFNSVATREVLVKYEEFKLLKGTVNGSGEGGMLSQDENRELMYHTCADCGWWDWRRTRSGREQFPPIPLSWK
jgi:hypothetical protein